MKRRGGVLEGSEKFRTPDEQITESKIIVNGTIEEVLPSRSVTGYRLGDSFFE